MEYVVKVCGCGEGVVNAPPTWLHKAPGQHGNHFDPSSPCPTENCLMAVYHGI